MNEENKQKKISELYLELIEAGVKDDLIVTNLHNYIWSLYLDTLPPYEALLKTTQELQIQTNNITQTDKLLEFSENGFFDDDLFLEEDLKALEEFEALTSLENNELKRTVKSLTEEVKELRDKVNDVLILEHLHKSVMAPEDSDEENKGTKGKNKSKDKDKK